MILLDGERTFDFIHNDLKKQNTAMRVLLEETIDVFDNEDGINHEVSKLRLEALLEKIKAQLEKAKDADE